MSMTTLRLSPLDVGTAAPRFGRGRRVARTAIALTAAAAFVGGMGATASAAPGGNTTANVAVTAGITMTALTPSFTITGTPGATVQSLPVTYNVETNNVAGYAVGVLAATATMVGTGANVDIIPIGVLTVSETAGGTFTGLSTTVSVPVHTQAVRSANGGDPLSSIYQLRIPNVNADTYTATLTYLATAL